MGGRVDKTNRIGFPAEHCGTHNLTDRFFKEQNLPSMKHKTNIHLIAT